MSCNFLRVAPSKQERQIYDDLSARLILHRMGDALQDIKDISKKDWAQPKCCQIFYDEKDKSVSASGAGMPFSEFMTQVDDFKGNPFGSAGSFLPGEGFLTYREDLRNLAEEIIRREETQFPTPLLESIQIHFEAFEPGAATSEQAAALTRTFYLPASQNNKSAEDIKLLKGLTGQMEFYLRDYFSVELMLNLLSRERCPHFPHFSAFLACYKNSDCKTDTPPASGTTSNLRFVQLGELAKEDLTYWITDPKPSNPTEKIMWDMRRPGLLEVENVLFQIAFTLYMLSFFNMQFTGSGMQHWRVYTCQKAQGYDRYKIRSSPDINSQELTFFVPNFGNFLLFHPNDITSGQSAVSFLVGDDSKTTIERSSVEAEITSFRNIVTSLQSAVSAWTPAKPAAGVGAAATRTLPIVNTQASQQPFEFNIEKEAELTPVALNVNEQTKIADYLTKLDNVLSAIQARFTSEGTTTRIHRSQAWAEVLNQGFPNYSQVSTKSNQTVSDLVLLNDYGIPNINAQLKVPPFVTQVIYDMKAPADIKAEDRKNHLYAYLQETQGAVATGADSDVAQIASSMQSRVGKEGKMSLLFDLRDKLADFLKNSLEQREGILISDRYRLDASQLALRKSMHTYGNSFLTQLSEFLNRKDKISPREWIRLGQLRDYFGESAYLAGRRNPLVADALREQLRVSKPEDLRAFLNSLMFLSYLKTLEPTTATATPAPPGTAPTPTTGTGTGTGTTTTTTPPKPISDDEFRQKIADEWSLWFGIPPAQLKSELDFIANQHRLTRDVKSELTILTQKLAQLMNRPQSVGTVRMGQTAEAELDPDTHIALLKEKIAEIERNKQRMAKKVQ